MAVAATAARGVAAAHAGWRGLAAGVLERAVEALCEAARCPPLELHAWLGASIGPARFQVGAAAGVGGGVITGAGALPPRGKWLAHLPGLARDRLQAVGVTSISGGSWCTVADSDRFFSFRRDRTTGRMAALIWIHADGGR